MIIEGIVTTLGRSGRLNIAPMGPRFDRPAEPGRFILRPFRTSTTFRNLSETGEGVFHVTEDVLLLARAAIGDVDDAPTRPAEVVRGAILLSSVRYHEFRVVDSETSDERASFVVETVATGRLNDWIGLNRARAAVVEAAILATRIGLIDPALIVADFARLGPIVAKTGGAAEAEAFALLRVHVNAGDSAG